MDNVNNRLTEEEEALLSQALIEAHEEPKQESNDLPVNSPSLLVDEIHSRFSSAEWFKEIQRQSVLLAGIGGIGSWTALLLSRANIGQLIIYDDDTVDKTNMSGQLYLSSQVGALKSYATASNIRNFSEFTNVISYGSRFERERRGHRIMIGGFDNMIARRDFYESWKREVLGSRPDERKNFLLIDARLAAEELQVFCITGVDQFLMKKYEEEWLFNDSEADETPCSYKQTSFCANMTASIIVNLVVNFVANKCNPLIERELPFYTNYDATTMRLKTYTV